MSPAQRLRAQAREIKRIAEKRTRLINNHSIPKLPKNDFRKFNEIIGNPKHPATLERMPLLDYQFEINKRIKKKRKTITNKGRKMGSSETHLRTIAEGAFDEFMFHGGIVCFGNRQNEANNFIDDFDALFHDGLTDLDGKKWGYGDLVMQKSASRIDLYSNFFLEAYPAQPTALRGPKNIKVVLVSEAAHVPRVDDSKLYTALRPLVANDPMAVMMFESTPNGKRGFFYDQSMLAIAGKNDFDYAEYPYTMALGKLLSPEFIEQEKRNPRIDFEQEYNCKFTSSQNSAFREEEIQFEPKKVTDWSDTV